MASVVSGSRALLAGVLWLLWSSVAPGPAAAQDWREYPRSGGCVGGTECSSRPLEVPLEDRPVLEVRFVADDNVGRQGGGRLRVALDGRPLGRELVLESRGRIYELDAGGRRGRTLRFEAVGSAAVNIRSIEVLYGSSRGSREPYPERSPSPRAGAPGSDDVQWLDNGWALYRNRRGCIGGRLCEGDSLRIRLLDEPVERLRFYAHDDYGTRRRARLKVYLDHRVLESNIDVERRGSFHSIEVHGRRGEYLIFEAMTDDEVLISDIEVLYRELGRRRDGRYGEPRSDDRGSSRYRYGYDGPGECLGGDLCNRRYRIEVLLEGLPIDAVRFHAHSDVGERAEGLLRVSLDRDILREELDIPRRGDFFQIDLDETRGRLLVFEAIGRGEVVVEDIEVRYEGKSWTRLRVEEESGPR